MFHVCRKVIYGSLDTWHLYIQRLRARGGVCGGVQWSRAYTDYFHTCMMAAMEVIVKLVVLANLWLRDESPTQGRFPYLVNQQTKISKESCVFSFSTKD